MSLQYQKECLTSPIIPCAGYSAIFSAVDAGLGNRVTPGTLGEYQSTARIFGEGTITFWLESFVSFI